MIHPPPTLAKTEDELLLQCQHLEGLTLQQLALLKNLTIPSVPAQRKGWVGQIIERAFGLNNHGLQAPDFSDLSIELKTLPIGVKGTVLESTFVTTIPLLTIHQQTWAASHCFQKLKRVLWIPYEADSTIPFMSRRIGRGFLWSPSEEQAEILKKDWHLLSSMIGLGKLDVLDARLGEYLQVRPKAASGRSLCYGFDERGDKVLTLPRGFYLRSRLTTQIFQQNLFSYNNIVAN